MSFAFLDIETSWEKTITVIGIYRSGEGTTQLVAPDITRERLVALLEDVEILFTYNGAGFDLPIIEAHLGMTFSDHCAHRDLLLDCRKNNLKGGLKVVEQRLGIHRDSEGINGLTAMKLWSAHRQGHPDALEILLRYNKEDCENLETIAWKLNLIPAPPAVAAMERIRQNS